MLMATVLVEAAARSPTPCAPTRLEVRCNTNASSNVLEKLDKNFTVKSSHTLSPPKSKSCLKMMV